MKTTVLSDILKSVMTPFGTHGPLPLIEWQLMEVRQWPRADSNRRFSLERAAC